MVYSKKTVESHLTIESFTIDLVSNEFAQLLPDKTLSFFINFLPEQLKLEGPKKFAISALSYPSMYPAVTGGMFMCFDKNA